MPIWKYLVNRGLTRVENAMMGTELTEAHTGYRAYSRRFLLTIPFLRNADDFSFDTEVLMQAVAFGMHGRPRSLPAVATSPTPPRSASAPGSLTA